MINPYKALFESQKVNQYTIANSSCKARLKKLNSLKKAIEIDYRDAIKKALQTDLGKPDVETELTEIYIIISEINFAKKHLRRWMRKQHVKTPLSLLGSTSYYVYEPKGVCLIMSPWNFPFNLTFGPLVSAIAAGNTVMIKPSEKTPNCSAVMSTIVNTLFNENEVALVEGDVETAKHLLELPFNHIFFTGSPNVGKIIMKAASKHLASVTLELGGKSPTVIDATADIKTAAKRIVWGKFLNAGQTCIAPDYVLIDASIKDAFVEACKSWIITFYTSNPETSESYGNIVDKTHFNRLKTHLNNAIDHNAVVEVGNVLNEATKTITPTILTNIGDEASVLHDEVFGPILPIITYVHLDDAIAYINDKPRPLALYIYSKSKQNQNEIIKCTRAGSTCINNNVVQYSNPYLPFGGINNSGIGKSHGLYGFEAFSNKRAVIKQYAYGISELLYPPYNKLKQTFAKLTVKWF